MRAINRFPLMLAALALASCASPPATESDAPQTGQRSADAVPSSPDTPVSSDAPATSVPTEDPSMPQCDAAKAQFVVGQTYTDALATQAQTAAGAKIVRRLMPGQAVTMEFNDQRLNLETDASGRIIAARCG